MFPSMKSRLIIRPADDLIRYRSENWNQCLLFGLFSPIAVDLFSWMPDLNPFGEKRRNDVLVRFCVVTLI